MTTESETITLDQLTEMDSGSSSDSPPKRGRGRPRGSTNKPKLETGNPASSNPARRGSRAGSRAWVREQVTGIVSIGNLGLGMLSRADALDEREMDMLSDAVAAEAMSSERIMRWLNKSSAFSAHALLIGAIGAIAIPRLQRRGMLPKSQLSPAEEAALDEYLRANGATPEAETEPTPYNSPIAFPMEAGSTYGADGGYR